MPTVLLVDDSATDRRMIGGILERHGISVRYAENGNGAIKQLRRALPDMVLTDMQMPEMDGLELVKAVRTEWPQVPVMLMTGHGSETLAAQALQQGAASYVPKSQISQLLVDSIRHVLELVRGESSFHRLIDQTRMAEFQFELANDPTLVEPLVELVQQMAGGLQVCDAASRLQLGVAFEHAILNAMFHGNLELTSEQLRAESLPHAEQQVDADRKPPSSLLQQRRLAEPYASRKVHIRAVVTREEVRVTVRDEGPGFDVQKNLNVSLSDDETAGRGLVLMWALTDKVIYSKSGNEVTLIKTRHSKKSAPTPPSTTTTAPTTAKTTASAPAAATKKFEKYGELIPLDGSKSIVLTEPRLSVGRDPACDVALPFSDISSEHCLLYMYCGWWYVKDLKSANGTRINKTLVDQKRLAPGCTLGIATHQYEVRYSPWDLGAEGITPPVDPF